MVKEMVVIRMSHDANWADQKLLYKELKLLRCYPKYQGADIVVEFAPNPQKSGGIDKLLVKYNAYVVNQYFRTIIKNGIIMR